MIDAGAQKRAFVKSITNQKMFHDCFSINRSVYSAYSFQIATTQMFAIDSIQVTRYIGTHSINVAISFCVSY